MHPGSRVGPYEVVSSLGAGPSTRGELRGQDLDGDVTPEARIARFPHLAHAACPERASHLVRSESRPGCQRHTGSVALGTAAYMSPEQAQGRTLDEQSDIFSFGAVLYEMVAGTRAFGGHSTADVLSAVLRDDPRPLQAPHALAKMMNLPEPV